MKRFKIYNPVARLQDYLRDPIDLYFLVCQGLDEDVYRFDRKVSCYSCRDSDGHDLNMRMIFRGPIAPLSKSTCNHYRRSLKTKKRMYKKTLKSQVIRRWY